MTTTNLHTVAEALPDPVDLNDATKRDDIPGRGICFAGVAKLLGREQQPGAIAWSLVEVSEPVCGMQHKGVSSTQGLASARTHSPAVKRGARQQRAPEQHAADIPVRHARHAKQRR